MLRANETVGAYTFLSLLETHGLTSFWLASRDGPPGTPNVVLKCCDNSQIDASQIQREADIWARVTGHPNIVSFIETVPYNDNLLIVCEYISGGSLAEILAEHEGSALSYQRIQRIMCGILAGLEHLHAKGVINRDIKPAYIYLRGEDSCLGNFERAGFSESGKESYAAGTPLYMAPEAWAGMVTPQVDLWSAAVVLYELLTGRPPFSGTTIQELAAATLYLDPEPLPATVPPRLQSVVARGLQKNPTQRYETAADMSAALREAFASGGV